MRVSCPGGNGSHELFKPGDPQQRLATGQAAVEYLSWVDEVLSGRQKGLALQAEHSRERIRRRLLNARIPLTIDATGRQKLAAFEQPHNLDGSDAITARTRSRYPPRGRTDHLVRDQRVR
jgi:hypothetical protein